MQTLPGQIILTLLSIILINIAVLPAAAEQRAALVIGNGAYSSAPLKNPVNDAADMAAVLKKLGFQVDLRQNADLETMEGALEAFGNRLKRGGVGLFYYAGHGVQVNGVNYLIPVGARINKESDVRFKALDAGRVLAEMENANNGMNIVLLDACRDNPFGKSFRSAARGLAIVGSSPAGTFISYSTGPGQVARDGEGRNSPYTRALLQNIVRPGLPIGSVFMKVRSKVKAETGQVPWELSSLEGEFYFVPAAGKSEVKKAAADAAAGESRQLEEERQQLAAARELLEQKKELEAQREKLAAEQAALEAKRAALLTDSRRDGPDMFNRLLAGLWRVESGTIIKYADNKLYIASASPKAIGNGHFNGQVIGRDFVYTGNNKFVYYELFKTGSREAWVRGELEILSPDTHIVRYPGLHPFANSTIADETVRLVEKK